MGLRHSPSRRKTALLRDVGADGKRSPTSFELDLMTCRQDLCFRPSITRALLFRQVVSIEFLCLLSGHPVAHEMLEMPVYRAHAFCRSVTDIAWRRWNTPELGFRIKQLFFARLIGFDSTRYYTKYDI